MFNLEDCQKKLENRVQLSEMDKIIKLESRCGFKDSDTQQERLEVLQPLS